MICLGASKGKQRRIVLAEEMQKQRPSWEVRTSNNIASGICLSFSPNSNQTNIFHKFGNPLLIYFRAGFLGIIRCLFWSHLRTNFQVPSDMLLGKYKSQSTSTKFGNLVFFHSNNSTKGKWNCAESIGSAPPPRHACQLFQLSLRCICICICICTGCFFVPGAPLKS